MTVDFATGTSDSKITLALLLISLSVAGTGDEQGTIAWGPYIHIKKTRQMLKVVFFALWFNIFVPSDFSILAPLYHSH